MMMVIRFGDKIASTKDEYEKIVNDMMLDKALKILDEKEKEVIILRYYKEMTQTQIAKILKTSQVQISRIEKKALKKMHDKIAI